MLVVFLLIVALLSDLAPTKGAMPYKACGHSQAPEVRDLYVASCDSRGGWKEFMALRNWNVTGYELRQKHDVRPLFFSLLWLLL